MSHIIEILTNAVNVGVSVAILALLVVLAGQIRKHGKDLVVSRLFLQQREAGRAATLVTVGLVVFLISNVLELYGDIYHIDWVVNEIVETISLFIMIAGLAKFASILHIPARRLIDARPAARKVEP